jgi:ATP-binding protein involved in chromosome partitioning
MGTDATPGSPEERFRTALAEAEVGRNLLTASLTDAGAIGDVRVASGRASVPVTLPVPSAPLRRRLERDIARVGTRVDGVDTVACTWEASVDAPGQGVAVLPEVDHVVAVASGKGGVGKSTVATNLAVALASTGAEVGLLDADVYGPNAPAMLGLSNRAPGTTPEDEMVPREAHGVRTMSMEFVVGEDDPVIWRGPVVDDVLKQLFEDVRWGTLDYLIVDLPPGTGDPLMTLVKYLPVTGAVIVTTPQPVAVDDAARGLEGFVEYDVPILGIAENMHTFECPDCHTEHDLFGSGGADRLSDHFDVPVLGRLPLDPSVQAVEEITEAPPGVSIPGIGELRLPRTSAEREATRTPKAARGAGDATGAAIDLLAARTVARLALLAAGVGGRGT